MDDSKLWSSSSSNIPESLDESVRGWVLDYSVRLIGECRMHVLELALVLLPWLCECRTLAKVSCRFSKFAVTNLKSGSWLARRESHNRFRKTVGVRSLIAHLLRKTSANVFIPGYWRRKRSHLADAATQVPRDRCIWRRRDSFAEATTTTSATTARKLSLRTDYALFAHADGPYGGSTTSVGAFAARRLRIWFRTSGRFGRKSVEFKVRFDLRPLSWQTTPMRFLYPFPYLNMETQY